MLVEAEEVKPAVGWAIVLRVHLILISRTEFKFRATVPDIGSRASRPHWTQGNMIYIDMLRNTVVWGEGTKIPQAKARWGRQRLTP
jgi:hypothetical protein